MKCIDCQATAAPDRARCPRCLARCRDWARAHPVRKAADPSADYPCHRLRLDRTRALEAYMATPPQRWAMLFWDRLGEALGRTGSAVYRTIGRRWGWPAKVKR